MNGDTVHEIKALLADGKAIPVKTALRLSLELQSQLFDLVSIGREALIATDKRVEKLERYSIIYWIEKHPKLSTALITAYIVISAMIDFKEVVAKVLAIK